MMPQSTSITNIVPQWQGIHHVALVTPDLDATIEFYRDILGMEVTAVAPANEMHGRHAAAKPGGSYVGLHFFEQRDVKLFNPPDLKTMYWLHGAYHHISFALPDEAAGLAFRDQLAAQGIEMTPVMDQGDVYNLLFQDVHGMLLEIAWPKGDSTT